MKSLRSKLFMHERFLGLLILLGIYPLVTIMVIEQQDFTVFQWSLWLLFYFFVSLIFVFYAVTRIFFQSREDIYGLLYLNLFIGLSVIMKLVPLPLGMSMAFVIPLIAAAWVHPYWGSLIGFFMMLVASVLSGGLGPWTPIQCYMMLLIPGALIWVPSRVCKSTLFLMIYAGLWGFLYGFVMTLYFWPMVSPASIDGSLTVSFWTYYVSTSLLWDVFRAAGNVLFLGFFGPLFAQGLRGTMALSRMRSF